MQKKRITGWALVLFLLAPLAAVAQTTGIKEHTVVKGDTLWGISKQELKDPFQWPGVWKKNPEIKNPDRIYPDQIIRIPLELAAAEKKGEEVEKASAQTHRENTESGEQRKTLTKDEGVAVTATSVKKSAAAADRRFEDIRGTVLYTGEVIEGHILSMNAEKVVIRTKNDAILSYLFVEEIEDFIKD